MFTLNIHQQRTLRRRPCGVPGASPLPDPLARYGFAKAVPKVDLTSSSLVKVKGRGPPGEPGPGGHHVDLSARLPGVAQVADNSANKLSCLAFPGEAALTDQRNGFLIHQVLPQLMSHRGKCSLYSAPPPITGVSKCLHLSLDIFHHQAGSRHSPFCASFDASHQLRPASD